MTIFKINSILIFLYLVVFWTIIDRSVKSVLLYIFLNKNICRNNFQKEIIEGVIIGIF